MKYQVMKSLLFVVAALLFSVAAQAQPVIGAGGYVANPNGGQPIPGVATFCSNGTAALVVCTGGGGSGGTVTANQGAGNFATPWYVQDESFVQPGSSTTGQYGALGFGAVVSAPPSYTSGTSQPYTLTTNGVLNVVLRNNFGNSISANGAGNLLVAPSANSLVNCGGSTSATINTPTTLLAAALATKVIVLQNNGTVPILFSFVVTTGLSTTNSFSLAAGQTWTSPGSVTPNNALTVASGTASQPIACEYN